MLERRFGAVQVLPETLGCLILVTSWFEICLEARSPTTCEEQSSLILPLYHFHLALNALIALFATLCLAVVCIIIAQQSNKGK